jgi:hypothetical protein
MYSSGLGVSVNKAAIKRRKAEERLAEQRRITEAETLQKRALLRSQAIEDRLLGWLPKVAIVAGAVGLGLIIYRQSKRRG